MDYFIVIKSEAEFKTILNIRSGCKYILAGLCRIQYMTNQYPIVEFPRVSN